MPVRNAVEGMQGKAAGVDITTSQRPGQVGDINIRGVRSIDASNSPLYVIDGMVIQNGGIENINPQDIESIDILKDASATAVYGSRGANGVVLITTKKGKAGKIQITYDGTVSFDHLYNVTKNMTAAQWLQYSRYAYYNAGQYPQNPYTDGPSYEADKQKFGQNASSWKNVDQAWVDGVYHPELVGSYDWEDHGKRTGITTEHTVGISGGTENFRGYGSFGYLKQKGVMPGQDYTRYTLKSTFDITPKDWLLSAGVSVNASYADQNYGYNFRKSKTGAGDYYSALRGMLPWTVPYDENGEYIRNPNADVNIINPIDEVNYTINNRRVFRASGLVYGQLDFGKAWNPLEGLSYRIQFGPEFRYDNNGIASDANGINGDGNNVANYDTQMRRSWTLDNLIYYNRTFAEKHRVNVTLLQSASAYHFESSGLAGRVASSEELWWNIGSNNDITRYSTNLSETSMTSYMARVNYGFDDRYLLTASMRWDGSSVLAKGNKWASFPSVALAWRINRENFLKETTWIQDLKLRLGYGVTGNAAVSPYSTLGQIQSVRYPFGDKNYVGYVPSDLTAASAVKLANKDLTWEKTTQYNVGVDFSFLNGRLSGSIDWYKTKTKDLLLTMSIPSTNGYWNTLANVGRTSGHGWDIQLNSTNIVTRDFQWTTSLTFSLDRTYIDQLANGMTELIDKAWFVGKELGLYYDYVYDGIWKTSEAEQAAKYGRKPGDVKVVDINEDGAIDANNDRAIVGHQRPDWTAGMNNTFNYRGFDFSFFIYARWGFTMPAGGASLDGRYMQRDLDYWIEGINEDARYQRPVYNGSDPYGGSLNYSDGSFIKLRNISLGYSVPANFLNKIGVGVSSLRVYAQVQNPFFIYKKTKWLDPDLRNYDNQTEAFGSATSIRSYTIGLNLAF
ncbi:MAG: SusC/RagA family TonB-linked outer membrane protein, partial [Ruminococcus flavefaciens]|nr:SusC/RagA family TonB-linked outer membrane protein [Ruminococcus flavefaciens]